MPRKRDKNETKIDSKIKRARVVSCSKRCTINMGDYQSYSIEYGLEDIVEPGETNKQAFKRLKADIEDAIDVDLQEATKMAAKINKARPKKGGK